MTTLDQPRVAGPDQPAVRRRHIPVWVAIVAASLPMFMATLDNLVMTSALPVIQVDLGSSVGQLSWFMNAYTLTFATFMLPAATLGDRLGRRRMMLAGVTVFTLASIASALSTSSEALIAARAVQGLGAAAIMPLSLTLLAAAVPPAMRAAAIGIWGGVSGLGVALGPVIGGAVVEGVSWQAIFWLNVPVAVVAVPLLLVAIPESRGVWQKLDPFGVLLLGGAVFLGIWGIVHGNDDGWSDPRVLVPLVLSAALLPAYVLWARGRAHAVLPLRLFSARKFTVANIIFLMFTLGMFGTVFLLAQYLQVVQGYTPLQAGVATMPWTIAPMVVAPLAGLIAPRVGTRLLIVAGLGFEAIAMAWLGLTMSAATPYLEMLPAFILAGIGMGLVFAPLSTAVLATMKHDDHAKASGTNATLREVGVALGIAVLTAVFVGAGGSLTPTGYVDAAIPAVLVGAGALALATLLAIALPAGRAAANADAAPSI